MIGTRQTSAPRHACTGPAAAAGLPPVLPVATVPVTVRPITVLPVTVLPSRRRVRKAVSLLTNLMTLGGLLGFLVLGVGPHTGAYRPVTMLTGSMRPLYPTGAILIVTPQPITELAPGQVVTFTAPIGGSPIVTHRVVAVDRTGRQPVITTKGDANPGNDAWSVTMTGPTFWQVRGAIPVLGTVLRTLREPVVAVVMTKAVPVLLLLGLLKVVWRPKRRAG